MTFFDLVQASLQDSLGTSIPAFAPELIVCATIVAMLLVRMVASGRAASAYPVMLLGTLAAFLTARTSFPSTQTPGIP